MVQLDWAVGGEVWLKPDRNQSTCEAQSIANCAALKANGTAQRCLIYHNMCGRALASARALLCDPASSPATPTRPPNTQGARPPMA